MSLAISSANPLLSAPACRVAYPWLTAGMYALLELEAARRGSHPDRLAADLINHMLLKITPRRQHPPAAE
jgi:hypothetical protein